MRQHAKDTTDRWIRSLRQFPSIKQSGMQLADMGKNHSCESFFGYNDPLESVIFSALLKIRK